MKTPVIIVCLLLACNCLAQSTFEGTIKWSMKMEITDPAAKAKMEEGQKKMNDPATQAKMKEMEKQMNDPQYKAMMDANPQMKAQMEKAMKMMQGGGMTSMMPTSFTVRIKGNNSLAQMEGGMMRGMEVLNRTDKNQSYSIDRSSKTYSVLPQGSSEAVKKTNPDVKVTKTNETAKILNYNCTKTIVEMTQNGKAMKNFYWTTTEIKDLDFKSLSKQRVGRDQSMFYENIEGVPLKMEMTMTEGTMTMEVTEIKRESLSSSLFELPADFKEVQGFSGKY